MDLGLKGKSVLITGGSKGIGLACARSFAAEGCRVHLAARNRERLEQANAARSARSAIHAVDLRDGAACAASPRNAPTSTSWSTTPATSPAAPRAIDEAKWRHAWELKVFGYINLTRELYARMKARGSGVIVNVIGMAGENPSSSTSAAPRPTPALAAFTKAWARARAQHGVRVLGVHPPVDAHRPHRGSS